MFGKKEKSDKRNLQAYGGNSQKMPINDIKVLGSGCKSCHLLYENTKKAVSELNLGINIEYVTDLQEIIKYGAIQMPALIINGKAVLAGETLKPAEIRKLIENID